MMQSIYLIIYYFIVFKINILIKKYFSQINSILSPKPTTIPKIVSLNHTKMSKSVLYCMKFIFWAWINSFIHFYSIRSLFYRESTFLFSMRYPACLWYKTILLFNINLNFFIRYHLLTPQNQWQSPFFHNLLRREQFQLLRFSANPFFCNFDIFLIIVISYKITPCFQCSNTTCPAPYKGV